MLFNLPKDTYLAIAWLGITIFLASLVITSMLCGLNSFSFVCAMFLLSCLVVLAYYKAIRPLWQQLQQAKLAQALESIYQTITQLRLEGHNGLMAGARPHFVIGTCADRVVIKRYQGCSSAHPAPARVYTLGLPGDVRKHFHTEACRNLSPEDHMWLNAQPTLEELRCLLYDLQNGSLSLA